MEWEIISKINFELNFPNSFTFLKFYSWKIFRSIPFFHKKMEYFFQKALETLKIIQLDISIYKQKPHLLALSIIYFTLTKIFNEFDEISSKLLLNFQNIVK